jgi:hypothetical protein
MASEVAVGQTGLPEGFEEILAEAYKDDPRLTDTPALETAEQDAETSEVEEEAPSEPEVDAEDKGEDVEEEAVDEEEPNLQKYGKRAQQRIRQLNTRNRDLETKLSEIDARVQQSSFQAKQAFDRQQYQYALQMQQMQSQLKQYKDAFENARGDQDKDLDPVQKLERNILKQAETLADKKVAAIEAKREAQEKARVAKETAAYEARERQGRFSRWQGELNTVLPKTVLAGFSPEKTEELRPLAEAFLLAYGASAGQGPADVAQDFNKFVNELVTERVRLKGRKSGEVLSKNKGLPAASSGVRAATVQGEDYVAKPPPKDQLARNRFSTAMEWYKAGSPELKIK